MIFTLFHKYHSKPLLDPRGPGDGWGKYTFFMFLQSIDGTLILPFAAKIRESRSTSFTFDNLVKMAIDLGFVPAGFVGDIEFHSIFSASVFSNYLMVYDIHHILRRLIRNYQTNFPSFAN